MKLELLKRYGDVEPTYGFLSVLGAPVIAVFMSSLILIADFGALQAAEKPSDVLSKSERYIHGELVKSDPRMLASAYASSDGTVESRFVIRVANSGRVFDRPLRQAVYVILLALACLVSGAAVSLRLWKYAMGDQANSATFSRNYRLARGATRFIVWLCTAYILYGLNHIGLLPFGRLIVWAFT